MLTSLFATNRPELASLRQQTFALIVTISSGLSACITTSPTPSIPNPDSTSTPELASTLLATTGGFTLSPTGENLASSNLYAVAAYPERGQKYDFRPTAEHIASFKSDNDDLLTKPNHTLGGWCEGKDSTPPCYLDVSIVVADEIRAVSLGKACNQQSIAHLKPEIRFISTGGDGGALQGEALARCQHLREAAAI